MPVLGITGGIASGKSTFLKLLLERITAEVFDTDACSRRLLDEDRSVREEILKNVHPEAYDSEGNPNRPLLRREIYNRPEKKAALEEILHPRIRKGWMERAERMKGAGQGLFIVDIPLLFETRTPAFFDRIITIACRVETQLSRLREKRGLSPEISEKIIASQMPISVKIAGSHHVVWNEGSLETLAAQTDLLARYLHVRYG